MDGEEVDDLIIALLCEDDCTSRRIQLRIDFTRESLLDDDFIDNPNQSDQQHCHVMQFQTLVLIRDSIAVQLKACTRLWKNALSSVFRLWQQQEQIQSCVTFVA